MKEKLGALCAATANLGIKQLIISKSSIFGKNYREYLDKISIDAESAYLYVPKPDIAICCKVMDLEIILM